MTKREIEKERNLRLRLELKNIRANHEKTMQKTRESGKLFFVIEDVVQKLKESFPEVTIDTYWYSRFIKITAPKNSFDLSWEIVVELLNKLSLEDGAVVKVFDAFESEPIWHWQIDVRGMAQVYVYYAEQDPDCVPVLDKHISERWVCYKK